MELDLPVRTICGVPVHALTMREVVDIAEQSIESRRRLVYGVVNAAKIVKMARDAALRKAVTDADLILADGMSVVWASRWLGQDLPERVPGIDIMSSLLELANRKRYGVYVLGARQRVLDKAMDAIRKDYPNARIAGSRNGYFGQDEERQIAEDIRRSDAQMLFIGMTSPKKELFLDRWGEELGVSICHGVGGSIDVLGGFVRRAPRAWQRCGMEWLYRILQEPRRMWKRYLVTNCLFGAMVFRELVSGRRNARPASSHVSLARI